MSKENPDFDPNFNPKKNSLPPLSEERDSVTQERRGAIKGNEEITDALTSGLKDKLSEMSQIINELDDMLDASKDRILDLSRPPVEILQKDAQETGLDRPSNSPKKSPRPLPPMAPKGATDYRSTGSRETVLTSPILSKTGLRSSSAGRH